MGENNPPTETFSYTAYFSLSTPYLVMLCGLYLAGYWSSFHINPLEYIGLGQLIALAAYPLAFGLLVFFLGAVLSQILSPTSDLPPGGGADTATGKFLNKHWRLIAWIWVFTGAAMSAYLGDDPMKWIYLAVFFTPLTLPLNGWTLFVRLVPYEKLRTFVAMFVVCAIPVSFGFGRVDADRVLNKKESKLIVDVQRSRIPEIKAPAVYVGHLGDYFVLLETSSGQISFVQTKEKEPIFFTYGKDATK